MKTTVFTERRHRRQCTNDAFFSVDLLFNKNVVFKKKVLTYDIFNFVVDVGSSLGLWLGLSILNITDALIGFVYNIKTNKLFEK